MNTEQIIVLLLSLVILAFGTWAVLAQDKGGNSGLSEDSIASSKPPEATEVIE